MVVYSVVDEASESSFVARKRCALVKRLINLTKRNGYEIIQTNGQRVYAPPASRNLQPPPKGCEVFIGKLHKNVFEDELVPVFEKIGQLYKFRLMLDFTEKSRGYAFATYFNSEDANMAVLKLNNYEIRPNLHIGVYRSIDNCRLFIGNLPTDKSRDEVREMLNKYVEGLVEVIMYHNYENPQMNRGFIFAEFENHRMAAIARRQFTPENLIAWGQPLYVDWADPLPEVEPTIMAKVTILYLRNLPLDYTSEEIHTCICNVVGTQIIKKFHKMNDYGFVHFVNRSSAEFAKQKLKNFAIAQHRIGVEWARPRSFSKKNRMNNLPDNFCTSVPPNMRRLVHQRLANLSPNSSLSCNTTIAPGNSTMFDTDNVGSEAGSFDNFMEGTSKFASSSPTSYLASSGSEYSYFQGPAFFG